MACPERDMRRPSERGELAGQPLSRIVIRCNAWLWGTEKRWGACAHVAIETGERGSLNDRQSAQHSHRHGRPDGAGVSAYLWPSPRPHTEYAGARARRGRVRQRLLREPVMRTVARLVHVWPFAVAHAGL